MSAVVQPGAQPEIVYPDSDGQPMADNTLQFEWISTVMWNLEIQYLDDPNVFVAGDHLIYPVEGSADVRGAPDVYVAFGRPKGHRGSYRVWEEGGVFPQVVFEVWSPNNRFNEMLRRLKFYDRHGAEEYYILYPEFPAHVDAWLRQDDRLVQLEDATGHVSPRLGVRFSVTKGNLAVFGPGGRRFENPAVMGAELEAERERADAAKAHADAMQARADAMKARADAEREQRERLAAKLRELGLDPDAL